MSCRACGSSSTPCAATVLPASAGSVPPCFPSAAPCSSIPPTPAQLEEAHRLLELVLSQKPAMKPAVLYWQAVAYTHAHQFDQSVAALEALLDPSPYAPTDPQRRSVLYRAWQLALLLHPELN